MVPYILSSEDDGGFNQLFQIDMKELIGDSVGNMSISPTHRDLVLAARKGLFIIDLEAPIEVPRFLPQGGTWDVADVQWNPHPSHAEYIVSTSSERLLIWNLLLVGKTSIEHILQSHYRAVTDINWHPSDPNLVCSIGIDSWTWTWDIRIPLKPVYGLCAFNAGGTQVKWSRHDSHVLASSHLNEVLIWDRRKGSIPMLRMRAHDAKIYGIDWSRSCKDEIITCSLDKTIKVWNLNVTHTPNNAVRIFNTQNPVWRARELPFGDGMLSLPQRGETALELWKYSDSSVLLDTFKGHTDVVREFVWRDHNGMNVPEDYQLITWSKDKTLRFWPLGADTLQKIGTAYETQPRPKKRIEDITSFRTTPIGTDNLPSLSVPRNYRPVLSGTRAHRSLSSNPVLLPHQGSAARAIRHEMHRGMAEQRHEPVVDRRDGTMSKGNTKGGRPPMDNATWLSSFRADSVGPSRISSESRPPSGPERDGSRTDSGRRNSMSTEDTSPLLKEEINAALKLSPGIKLERANLAQNPIYTFGLHGPWGESSSMNVFIRVSFTFPRGYPSAKHPNGTPAVDIERSPLVPVKMRAYMMRRLREIRENQRPCLEACLRFLLLPDGRQRSRRYKFDSGSSSDDDEDELTRSGRGKDFSASLIRDHPNLAEPRSSQGVFGPNGQLVCIFRSLPRLVKDPQDLSTTPTLPPGADGVPRLFQSPLQLSDAVRRLASAASDHSYSFYDARETEDTENILRIMNNLLSFSRPKRGSSGAPDNPQKHSLLPKQSTVVYIKDKSPVVGTRRNIAVFYSLKGNDLRAMCVTNARIAHHHLRLDHERLFKSLATLLKPMLGRSEPNPQAKPKMAPLFIRHLIARLHNQMLLSKDVQLLAMFAIIILGLQSPNQAFQSLQQTNKGTSLDPLRETSKFDTGQRRHADEQVPISSSSRKDWTNKFDVSPMRHLVEGVQQETITNMRRESLLTSDTIGIHDRSIDQIARRSAGVVQRSIFSSKTWPPIRIPFPSLKFVDFSISLNAEPKPTRAFERQILDYSNLQCDVHIHDSPGYGMIGPDLHDLLVCHILAYAEMLHRWQLMQKRAELLKSLREIKALSVVDRMREDLDCTHGHVMQKHCTTCLHYASSVCSVCRLPAKGLTHICLACHHVTHLNCWTCQSFDQCPTGCGCKCKDDFH